VCLNSSYFYFYPQTIGTPSPSTKNSCSRRCDLRHHQHSTLGIFAGNQSRERVRAQDVASASSWYPPGIQAILAKLPRPRTSYNSTRIPLDTLVLSFASTSRSVLSWHKFVANNHLKQSRSTVHRLRPSTVRSTCGKVSPPPILFASHVKPRANFLYRLGPRTIRTKTKQNQELAPLGVGRCKQHLRRLAIAKGKFLVYSIWTRLLPILKIKHSPRFLLN
jgi:hypothetical protein